MKIRKEGLINIPFFIFEALCWFPVMLMIAEETYSAPFMPFVGYYTGLILLAFIASALSGRINRFVLGSIVFVGATAAFMVLLPYKYAFIGAAAGLPMFYLSLYSAGHSWEDVYSAKRMILPLVLYLGVFLVLSLLGKGEQAAPLGVGAFICAASALFILNRRMLSGSASMKSGLAKRIIFQNMWIVGVVVIVMFLILNIETLREAVGTFVLLLIQVIAKIILLFSGSSDSTGAGGGGESSNPDMSQFGEANTATFWLVLEQIFTVVAAIIIIVGGAFLLYKLAKKFWYFLVDRVDFLKEAYQDGYSDEAESLLSGKQIRDEFFNSFKAGLKRMLTPPPNWDKLTPVERLRYAYAKLVLRGKAVGLDARNMTPHEFLTNKRVITQADKALFEDAYNRARYSNHAITEADQANARVIVNEKVK